VWSVYRRSAPSANFSDAWFRGEAGVEDYPLFIKPDRPLSVGDVMGLMRDHFEGTPYDMTQGPDAGPFNSPFRLRPLVFHGDGQEYMWERPISSPHAGFTVVHQSRASLPDVVGGVTWFTPDDASTSCFTPLYCSIDALPAAYTDGDYQKFSWDSAWWVTNLVSNLAYDRWSRVYPDVQKAQAAREASLLKMQPVIEETAAKLAAADPALARTFLTNYSVSTADALVRDWRRLAESILTKHVDAYQKDDLGAPKAPGYSPEWLKKVVADRGELLKLPAKPAGTDH
jgi:dipeptidase